MPGLKRTSGNSLVTSESEPELIRVLYTIVGAMGAAVVSLCVFFLKKAFTVYEDVLLLKRNEEALWKNIDDIKDLMKEKPKP